MLCLYTITYLRPIYEGVLCLEKKILLKLLSSEWIHYPLTLQILAEGNISRTISWLTKYSLSQPPSNFVQYCTNAVQYKKFLPIKSIRVGWTYSMIICINLYSYSRYKSLISNISIRSSILSFTEWMKILWWWYFISSAWPRTEKVTFMIVPGNFSTE